MLVVGDRSRLRPPPRGPCAATSSAFTIMSCPRAAQRLLPPTAAAAAHRLPRLASAVEGPVRGVVEVVPGTGQVEGGHKRRVRGRQGRLRAGPSRQVEAAVLCPAQPSSAGPSPKRTTQSQPVSANPSQSAGQRSGQRLLSPIIVCNLVPGLDVPRRKDGHPMVTVHLGQGSWGVGNTHFKRLICIARERICAGLQARVHARTPLRIRARKLR